MDIENNIPNNHSNMNTGSVLMIIIKNLIYPAVLLVTPACNYLAKIFPEWYDFIEAFKNNGGAILILLAIIKLLIEIKKLTKKDK